MGLKLARALSATSLRIALFDVLCRPLLGKSGRLMSSPASRDLRIYDRAANIADLYRLAAEVYGALPAQAPSHAGQVPQP